MKCIVKTSAGRHQITVNGMTMVLRKNFPVTLDLDEESIKTLKSSKYVEVQELDAKVKKVAPKKKIVEPKGEIKKATKVETPSDDFDTEAPTVVETPKKKEEVKKTINNILQETSSKKNNKKNKGKKNK